MNKKKLWIPMFFLLVVFAGCGKTSPEVCSLTDAPCGSTSWTIDSTVVSGVLLAIKNNDLPALAKFVWPQGLRFSPYEYVNTGSDITLTTQQVANGLAMSRSFTWGVSDGSGEPIDLWIGQYFDKFVNDADWAKAPKVSYNQITQRGNTTNTIATIYSGKQRVEFYFSGFDPQYEGIDRKSLTLVFEQVAGQRYLIGIVHGAWTI